MWSICKKELRQFFSSLTGYIAIIVFLVANGLVLFVFRNNIFETGYASLERFFSFAPWVLIFLIPAITMRSFSDEFKGGTYEILQTKPLTKWNITLGKFLGALIVAVIALLPTLVYYFSVNQLAAGTGIDSGAATGSYLGLLLLAALFTAIGIVVSSFTSNAVVAFIISLITCVLFYYGFTAISQLSAFQNGADYYIQMIGIDFHYRSMSRGVIDTRDLVYFLSLLFFLLLLTRQNLARRQSVKRSKPLFWIGLAAALFALNFISTEVHQRFDLTAEKRYSLSAPTRQLLRNLETPVEIEVFLKGEFPASFRKLAVSVDEALQEFREYGGANISIRYTDPFANATEGAEAFAKNATATVSAQQGDAFAAALSLDSVSFRGFLFEQIRANPQVTEKEINDAFVELYIDSIRRNYNITPSTLAAPSKPGDEQTVKQVLPGAVVKSGDKKVGVDFFRGIKSSITDLNDPVKFEEGLANYYNVVESSLEYRMASAIQKLTRKNRPVVGYALGHGETWGFNADDAFRTIASNYAFDTVNLAAVPYIPQFDALVMMKPTRPFSVEDKFKLDQYIMHGGRVFWMIDNMYADMDSLGKPGGFISYDRGLELDDLFFNYGWRLNPALLQDLQCDRLPQQTPDGQQRFVSWPYFPILEGGDDSSGTKAHPVSRNLDGVLTLFPTTIDTVNGGKGIRKTVLLQSSNNARVLPAPARIDFEFLQIAPDIKDFTQKNIPVALLLEGKFESHYRLRGRPRGLVDSMKALNYDVLNTPALDGRMIVVADGDVAFSPFSRQSGPLPMGANLYTGQQYANKEFFLNCLEYLTDPSDILATRGKQFVLRRLDPVRTADELKKWQLINIVVPILLVLLAGLGYQQYRKYRFTKN